MLNFCESLVRSLELGIEAAMYVTSFFSAPMNLACEEMYYPFVLFKRKNYAAIKYGIPKYSIINNKVVIPEYWTETVKGKEIKKYNWAKEGFDPTNKDGKPIFVAKGIDYVRRDKCKFINGR